MSAILSRRDFISNGVGCATGAAVLSGSASAADDTAILSATVVAHNGNPVANRKIAVSGQGGLDYHETDSDGILEAEVASNQRYKLGLYKSGSGQLHAPELNGVPHIEGLGYHSVGSGRTDIGTLKVPEAYLVDVRVLDSDGNPVANAEPDFRDDSGFGGSAYLLSTNKEGYLVIRNADFTGIEATGIVEFTVTIPGDTDGEANKQYSDSFNITEPSTIRVKEGEGMTIHSGTNNENSAKTTPTPTSSPTSTETTIAEKTSTKTAAPNSAPAPTTQSASTTSAGTETTVEKAVSSTTTETSHQRGFFKNGENVEDAAFLTDPLFMTVGGFALSVVGIVYQLIRGK
ncbi:hypothetical protein [Haladaptatus sp. CMSO5]|uniref:hypothetical protein n=1 Tax=Haladaptatus sp. CMSO5 TaxID=3120514 RepID=UPI002FCE301C